MNNEKLDRVRIFVRSSFGFSVNSLKDASASFLTPCNVWRFAMVNAVGRRIELLHNLRKTVAQQVVEFVGIPGRSLVRTIVAQV